MNNTIKYFAAATAIVLATSSCNDVLDINDTSTFGDLAVWSSQDNADAYVTAAYKSFNDQSIVANRDKFYDNYSDIMKSPYWWIGTYNRALFEQSRFGKGNADLFDCWSSVYGRIKRTNAMLNDLERYGHKWGDEWYEIRRAEGRFCNAINYFFLARVYGGVVLRTDHSGGGGWLDDGAYEQDRNRARISEEATYEYILNELKDVAKVLPEEWHVRSMLPAIPPRGMAGSMDRTCHKRHGLCIHLTYRIVCQKLGARRVGSRRMREILFTCP